MGWGDEDEPDELPEYSGVKQEKEAKREEEIVGKVVGSFAGLFVGGGKALQQSRDEREASKTKTLNNAERMGAAEDEEFVGESERRGNATDSKNNSTNDNDNSTTATTTKNRGKSSTSSSNGNGATNGTTNGSSSSSRQQQQQQQQQQQRSSSSSSSATAAAKQQRKRSQSNHHHGSGDHDNHHGDMRGFENDVEVRRKQLAKLNVTRQTKAKDLDTLIACVDLAECGTGEVARALQTSSFKPLAPAYTTMIKWIGIWA
jgi:hypothetical protein